MIWAHIRLILDESQEYEDRWVQLDTNDVGAAALSAKTFCAGYTVGAGRKAVVLAIDTVSHANSLNLSPEALQAQHNRVKSLTRRSA